MALVLVLLAAAGLSGCGSSGGSLTVTAVFSNVGDLASGAPVQYADVNIGSVTTISLDGNRARVVMSIERSAAVLGDVTAEVRRTTILGQRIVELVAPAGTSAAAGPGARSPSIGGPGRDGVRGHGRGGENPAGLLRDGQVIRHTEVLPGLQQLVRSGAAVFGAVSTSELSQIVQAGAEGFGGQSANLRQIIDDFEVVVRGYASQSSEITSLIDNFEQLGASLAPDSKAGAEALANLSRTTQILASQSSQLISFLSAMDRLAVQGRSLIESEFPQIKAQIAGLDAVAQTLSEHLVSLSGILANAPGSDRAFSEAVVSHSVQVLENLIICGVPGGGSSPSDPATTCNPGASSGAGSGS